MSPHPGRAVRAQQWPAHISELVTNSVRHSGAPADEQLTVRVHIERTRCRLEVEDPGHDGVIAPRPADLVYGGGIGLNLLQTLSEHCGANGEPPSTAPVAS